MFKASLNVLSIQNGVLLGINSGMKRIYSRVLNRTFKGTPEEQQMHNALSTMNP